MKNFVAFVSLGDLGIALRVFILGWTLVGFGGVKLCQGGDGNWAIRGDFSGGTVGTNWLRNEKVTNFTQYLEFLYKLCKKSGIKNFKINFFRY